ncbi:MAG TPA: DUF2442 domain-containing protein, partial [Verrucomicrobiae bacterium]
PVAEHHRPAPHRFRQAFEAEINEMIGIEGSSVYWPELDADIGVEGMLAGAREHRHYARKAVERAVRLGRLPMTVL